MALPRVFDSWALLALLQNERSAAVVTGLLVDCERDRNAALMSVVNLAEVWYSIARRKSPGEADKAIHTIHAAGIQIIGVDWPLARVAATLKSEHPIALGDSFAAALAVVRKGVVVTGDPEFKFIRHQVQVHWIGVEMP